MNAPHGALYKNSESLHAGRPYRGQSSKPGPVLCSFYVNYFLTMSFFLFNFYCFLYLHSLISANEHRTGCKMLQSCSLVAFSCSAGWISSLGPGSDPPAASSSRSTDPQTHTGRTSAAGAACDLSCGNVQSAESPPEPLYKR